LGKWQNNNKNKPTTIYKDPSIQRTRFSVIFISLKVFEILEPSNNSERLHKYIERELARKIDWKKKCYSPNNEECWVRSLLLGGDSMACYLSVKRI
jgi:hypothetical protein